MRLDVSGGPLVSVIHNAKMAVLKEGGEPTGIAIKDNDTGEVTIVPMLKEQMDQIYKDWNGPTIVQANPADVNKLILAT
jgi:hypothetical protein